MCVMCTYVQVWVSVYMQVWVSVYMCVDKGRCKDLVYIVYILHMFHVLRLPT